MRIMYTKRPKYSDQALRIVTFFIVVVILSGPILTTTFNLLLPHLRTLDSALADSSARASLELPTFIPDRQNTPYGEHFEQSALPSGWTTINLAGNGMGSVNVANSQLTISGVANGRFGLLSPPLYNDVSHADMLVVEAKLDEITGLNGLFSIYAGKGTGDFSRFFEFGIENGQLRIFIDGVADWAGAAAALPAVLRVEMTPATEMGRTLSFFYNGALVYSMADTPIIPLDHVYAFLYGWSTATTKWDYLHWWSQPYAGGNSVLALPTTHFQNPVIDSDFPDPGLLQVDGVTYIYATNANGKRVQAARSADWLSWEILPEIMPTVASWSSGTGGMFWAPEVIKNGANYLLYYTGPDAASGRQCIGVAVSALPTGPFVDNSNAPIVCQPAEGGSIDAHPFVDSNGNLYLYWKNDGNALFAFSYLYGQRLSADGLSLVGSPVRLVRNDLLSWEGPLVEAPTMLERNGQFYLFFSANAYNSANYAVGYATCTAPLGPCIDAPENPILASTSATGTIPPLIGPGHQDIAQLADGSTWIFYHAWDWQPNGARGSYRAMWIARLDFDMAGKPFVVQTPSHYPQRSPFVINPPEPTPTTGSGSTCECS